MSQTNTKFFLLHPIQPIISGIVRVIAKILILFLGTINLYHLNNSGNLANKIKSININNKIMILISNHLTLTNKKHLRLRKMSKKIKNKLTCTD